MKMTFQSKKGQRVKVHDLKARMKTTDDRKAIAVRGSKGRAGLSAQSFQA